jgi:hypothetical protein
MLWTIFKVLMVVWMLKLVLDVGASAIPIVLVVSLTALLLRLIIRRTSFSAGRLRDSRKTGKFNSTTVEQFAGASTVNSRFHNRIHKRIKEQYL